MTRAHICQRILSLLHVSFAISFYQYTTSHVTGPIERYRTHGVLHYLTPDLLNVTGACV